MNAQSVESLDTLRDGYLSSSRLHRQWIRRKYATMCDRESWPVNRGRSQRRKPKRQCDRIRELSVSCFTLTWTASSCPTILCGQRPPAVNKPADLCECKLVLFVEARPDTRYSHLCCESTVMSCRTGQDGGYPSTQTAGATEKKGCRRPRPSGKDVSLGDLTRVYM